jgi:hypothetical protein
MPKCSAYKFYQKSYNVKFIKYVEKYNIYNIKYI